MLEIMVEALCKSLTRQAGDNVASFAITLNNDNIIYVAACYRNER